MCANYLPTRADRLQATWGVVPHRSDWVAEAFPGHVAPFLRAAHDLPDRSLRADLGVFGLIPPWSRDGSNFRQCYNARSETVAEKPSFRHAWRNRQWCVIPAEAFFEPSYESGKAVRWRIESADGAPMALAGIWESWRAANGEPVLSFSMLTIHADAHLVMRRFHRPEDEKRSVVLLQPHQIDPWLSASTEQALAMLEPFDPSTVRTVESPRPARTARTAAPATPAESVPRTHGLFD